MRCRLSTRLRGSEQIRAYGAKRPLRLLDGHAVTLRLDHTVARRAGRGAAMRGADSASSQPPSIHWNGQNRLAGW